MTQSKMMMYHQSKIPIKIMTRQISKRKKTTTIRTPTLMPTPTPTPTTRTISCLPDEIIFFHILPKLPVRSLLRFNCVSKLWYETIHDPKFLASHLNHSKSKPSLVAVFRDQLKFRFLHLEGEGYHSNENASSVDLLNDPNKFIIGSCNGLTCTIACDQIDIINPSTRELLAIPLPDVQVSLPTGCVYYGFGFDPVMNEYKVIHIRLYARECAECVIYTLGTHSWRKITSASHYQQSYFPLDVAPICSSGALFWMTVHHNILTFDVHHEIFQLIPGPQVPAHLFRHSLFELRGCPCLVYVHDKLVDGLELRLYTLTGHHPHIHTKQQQSSNWTREKVTVRLPFKPDTSSFIRVVTFSEHIFLQWISNDGQFILRNANKGRSQKKSSVLMSAAYQHPEDVLLVNHVENLMSLKTLVPPGASATEVKYVSSWEASHESPTTPCSKRQREKREKDRLRILRSKGFLNTSCWYSSI